MKTGIELITEERQRQIDVEGYTTEHDLNHKYDEFTGAALAYLMYDLGGDWESNEYWAWDKKYFKPTDLKRNLIKAGALIAAAIDRLQNKDY